MSLAEELLADLEDDDVDMRNLESIEYSGNTIKMDETSNSENEFVNKECISKLRHSLKLQNVINKVENLLMSPNKPKEIIGPVESDPEYLLIVEANNLAVEIDNEIGTIHRFVRDKYTKRFPELDSLVIDPLAYLMTVKELGNDLEQAKNNENLQQYLTQATIMVVSVTASTTQGQLLSQEELNFINQECIEAVELNDCKLKIYTYVESCMSFIAPNLSAILGAATAAKLMGVAGGLTNLSKMPSCNILLLGTQKKALSGFSQNTTLPHTGFIYHCPFVQSLPPDLRRKAARLVASKSTLAARVDSLHESPDGYLGQCWRDEIEKKIDKLQEPPPVKPIKPLPAPVDPSRKKRGGKRVRRMKERYAMTELRKQANRVSFAEIEEDAYQEDLGLSLGQIGKTGSGRIRLPQIDEKTKVRISKTLQKNLQKQQAYGGSTTVKKHVSGTASSVAFTPLQGLEIINPQAAEKKVAEMNAKYFSNNADFLQLRKQ